MEDLTHSLAWGAFYDKSDNDTPMCQEEGCQDSAIQCTIPSGVHLYTGEEYDESYMYYCPEHAAENGFCCCCGTFIAGWRDFSDMCENCEAEVKSNDWDEDDDEDYYEGFYDDY